MKRMYMKRTWIILLALMTLCLSGCVRSGTPERVTAPANGDIFALDWDKISEEADKRFVNEDKYPMNDSINYNLDEENQVFQVILFVKQDTDKETAVKYVTDAAKGINDMAAAQDSYYNHSQKDSFGGLYAKLDLHLMAIPGGPDTTEEFYLVDQIIPAGTYEDVHAK